MAQLWKKKTEPDPEILRFTSGEDPILDQRLIPYDCKASIAHVKTLGKIGILTPDEVQKLVQELERIVLLHRQGKFIITPEQEDCHTAIENYLTNVLGPLGEKIHTARSRNDQVIAALRLFYKDSLSSIQKKTQEFIKVLEKFSKWYGHIPIPGYTHTRKAMPSSIALWAGGYREAFLDDLKLLDFVYNLVDQSPLGTGAGFGVPLEMDRAYTAKEAGFSRVQQNPIYAQLSRGKFESILVHGLAQLLLDINRMATDLILFSMPEFGFFILPEAFCTGSSIMPHKKNPDVLELLRAKYHAVSARSQELQSLIANLISGYHRDLQLSKKPVMEALDITLECMEIMRRVIENLQVDEKACQNAMSNELFATEEVYELVKKGVPFREAYRQVARRYE